MKIRSLKAKKTEYNEEIKGENLPSFSLSQEQIPEAKQWQVGKKYKLEIEVEMTGINKDEWIKTQPVSHRFKIVGIAVDTEEDNGKKGYV